MTFDLFKDIQDTMDVEKDKERVEKEKEIARSYKALFASAEGHIVLKHLKSITIDKPSLQQYYPEGMNTAMAMAYNEGGAGIVRLIDRYVTKDMED